MAKTDSSDFDALFMAAAFAALREAVVICANDGRVLMINTAARRLLALEDDDGGRIQLTDLIRLIDESTRDPIEYSVQELADEEFLRHISDNALIIRQNGTEFPFDITATRVEHEQVQGWIITLKDLFHVRSLADTIHFQRSHDQLTGLCNRAEFERRLQDCLTHAEAIHRTAALAFIDVDQFKVVNDTCGHIAGDELLRQITELIRFELHPGDMLARVGGDEFGVLLPNVAIDVAKKRCESIRRRVEEYLFTWSDKSFSISVSIGLVPIKGSDQNWASLMGQADAACFHAKEAGRNQVRVYSDEDAQVALRHTEMQWVSRIVQALQDDRFKLYAQPIVSTQTGEIKHQEILVRMVDTDRNLVPPGIFLPAAERFNLVLMIDKWVLSRTLQWLSRQIAENRTPIGCAINVSGASLGQTQFTEFVAEQVLKTGVPPHLLSFEVTETAAVSNLHAARAFISRLKNMGCRFAIDDFGAGMSSFAYLKNLPADYLKIDGAFVKEIATSHIDYAMVKSINEVGQVMGMKTIAEFVENDAILAKLREIGIDFAQGYGVGKPRELL